MDERDCRILMQLARAPFDSLEAIGRAIGTSGTAAKARLDRLRAAEIYGGLAALPSARALGRAERLLIYRDPAGKVDLDKVLEAEEVAWATLAFPSIVAVMLYRAEPTAPVDSRLMAARPPDDVVIPGDPRRHEPRVLSPLDLRVLEAVAAEPRASIIAQAARCGLSPRTVRQRRDALLESGDLVTIPLLDATREEGAIFYNAWAGFDRVESLRELRLTNAHRVATHHDPPGVFIVGYARTFAETHVVEEKLRALPGVYRVSFTVPHGSRIATERLAAWTSAAIARWDKARRSPQMI